jgi:hypothetical protein
MREVQCTIYIYIIQYRKKKKKIGGSILCGGLAEWTVEEFPQHANQEECLRDPKRGGMPVKL